MRLILPAFFAFLSLSHVLAGQIPEVNGIIGGAPSSQTLNSHKRSVSAADDNNPKVIPGKLRVVENSGVCETTPGVYQASGYADLAYNQSMWFWLFEARENPDTAPLGLWFNGGPGATSSFGLMQEQGPCRITNDSSTVVPNPMSWNNKVNMLYIDQPIGVGFSHGELLVNTSQEAAADVWNFLQIFFSDSRFAKYQTRCLALWCESYGGHYGPAFAAHFLRQNTAIEAGLVQGKILNLKVLGIGNGIVDALIQYQSYIPYATNNPYRILDSPSQLATANASLPECEKQISACYDGGSDSVCANAQDYCNTKILEFLNKGWDVYDVRAPENSSYPPNFDNYINSVRSRIGADVPITVINYDVYANFFYGGDWMRNFSPTLEFVINEGIQTLIYNGNADFIVNYIGVEAMVDNLQTKFSSAYKSTPWQTYKVAGQPTGQYKKAGSFGYLRVYGAGHEVPAYTYGTLQRGQAALQFFNQVTLEDGLYSTDSDGNRIDL